MEPDASRRPAVVVVEDDFLIRMEAADMIADAGFEVFEASNADEAIALMERHSRITVLFTDIEMPGSMDGLKLAHYVRDRWPPVKIIVSSGKMNPSSEDLPDETVFFGKPYQSAKITRALRDIAEQGGMRL